MSSAIRLLTPLLLALAAVTTVVSAQTTSPVEPEVRGAPLGVMKVQGNVWLIAGAGGNIAVQAGDEGIVVVDTGAVGLTDAVMAAIRTISDRPIRYVVNTSVSAQHVGGNAKFAALPGGSLSGKTRGAKVRILAQENVVARMGEVGQGGTPAYPSQAWPVDGYYVPERNLVFNGEVIDVIHQPSAHSDGDSIVYFRGSNVLVAGDIYTTTSLPLVDRARGGSLTGLLRALNKMIDIAVADDLAEGGTYIIPGHGRISDEADLAEYRDMVHIIRARIADLAGRERLSLAQVKSRRPLLGWEVRYGHAGWTTDMFIDTVYDEFRARRAP